MCDCEILHGLLCLICEVDCRILYGLLGLLCEKCDSFSLFIFDEVFINWGTCFAITRLSRQLPICLVYMPMRILIHLFSDSICLSASVFWLNCYEVFFNNFWCICFHISIAYRFCMASIHGEGIGFQFFLLLHTKCSGQEFLDSQVWVYLSIFVYVCVFCSSN